MAKRRRPWIVLEHVRRDVVATRVLLEKGGPEIVGVATAPATTGSPWADALRALRDGGDASGHDVLVLLGDSRVVTQRLRLPDSVDADGRRRKLEEAATQSCLLGPGDDLLLAVVETSGPKSGAGQVDQHWVAAPSSLVQPIADALLPLEPAGLWATSVECAVALADPADKPVAVLDNRGDPSRFILTEAGHPLGVRRFKLPLNMLGGAMGETMEGFDASSLVVGELQRTLKFFADSGLPAPSALRIIGLPAALEESVDGIREGLSLSDARTVRYAGELPEGADSGTAWLHAQVVQRVERKAAGWLIEPEPVDFKQLAKRHGPVVGGALCAAIGSLLLALDLLGTAPRRRGEHAALSGAVAELRSDLEQRRAALQVPTIVQEREAILAVLERPEQSVSRLCAALAGVSDQQPLRLTRLSLEEDGLLEIDGMVQAAIAPASPGERPLIDQGAALGAFAALEQAAAALPGVSGTDGGAGDASTASARGGEIPVNFKARLTRRLP